MKKLIGTVAVAAMLATAAFAEGLSFGSWGRALWIVGSAAAVDADGKVTDNTVTSWLGQSWGGAGPRTALGVSGSSDNVGFVLDLHANGGGVGVGDNALVWAKPVDMLKIMFAAKNDQNILRSDACFGLWNFDRIGAVSRFDEEGWIFPDILDRNISLILTPVEGLTIGYGFDVWVADTGWNGPNRVKPAKADDAAKYFFSTQNTNKAVVTDDSNRFVDQIGRTSTIAAAYSIANIGTIKVGFHSLGKGYDKEGGWAGADRKDKFMVAAAFEFTMLEKVYLAVGARIPLGGTFGKYFVDEDGNYNKGAIYVANAESTYVNLYARLNLIEGLGIHILGGVKLNSADYKKGDFKASGALGFRAGAEVDYAFSNGVGVFAEVEYANGIWMAENSGDNNDSLTFGLGVTKGFSNGVIGIAFEGSTNAYGRNGLKNADDLAWEVPLKLEYWF